MHKDKRVVERQIRLMNNFTKLVNGIFFKNDTIDGNTVNVHRTHSDILNRIRYLFETMRDGNKANSYIQQGFSIVGSFNVVDIGDSYCVYFRSNDVVDHTNTYFAKYFNLTIPSTAKYGFNAYVIIKKQSAFVNTIKARPQRTYGKFQDQKWNEFIDEINKIEKTEMTEKSVEFVGAPTEKNIRSKIAELVNLLIQPELDKIARIEEQIKVIQEKEKELQKQQLELIRTRDSIGQDINDKKSKIIWDL